MSMGLISRIVHRFRASPAAARVPPSDLPGEVRQCRWGYLPIGPYTIIDVDPIAEVVLGLARTDKLNVACQQFAQRLKVQPVANTHAVIDGRDVVILGADPDPDLLYSGCAAAWLLMDRYLEPVDAALYETIAHEAAPI
jgi:hypothetical protein